ARLRRQHGGAAGASQPIARPVATSAGGASPALHRRAGGCLPAHVGRPGETLSRTVCEPQTMQFLNLTLPSLFDNLALDEALLLDAEAGAGGEVLRCWAWPRLAVVLGA